ncbi:MAG: hypothetical protein JXM70_00110 [Pirellulales bacterium]|nr:hypothetical protein [Pirellulales bacterium]
MASQRITIAKFGGASAAAVVSLFREWTDARKIDDPTEWSSDQWPVDVRHKMDTFALALRSNGHKPPVIFFNEYIDLWSAGYFSRYFPTDDGHQLMELYSDRFQLWCYPLPDDSMLKDHLQHSTRLKRIRERNPQEDRWFVINLLEAVFAWDPIVDTAAIVVLREAFGGLVTDEELEESLKDIPAWVALD